MTTKTCIVTTSAERPVRAVAKDLSKAGFKVNQILEEINSITGSCDASQIGKLRAIRGVADVSLDTPIDIGPPDSPTTW